MRIPLFDLISVITIVFIISFMLFPSQITLACFPCFYLPIGLLLNRPGILNNFVERVLTLTLRNTRRLIRILTLLLMVAVLWSDRWAKRPGGSCVLRCHLLLATISLVVVLVGAALLHLLQIELLVFLLLLLHNLQQIVDPLDFFLVLILVYVLLIAAAVRKAHPSLIHRITITLPLCYEFVF